MNHTNKIEARGSDSTSQLAGKSPEEIAAERYWGRLKTARLSCPALNSYIEDWNKRARHSAEAKVSQMIVLEYDKQLNALKKLVPEDLQDLL